MMCGAVRRAFHVDLKYLMFLKYILKSIILGYSVSTNHGKINKLLKNTD